MQQTIASSCGKMTYDRRTTKHVSSVISRRTNKPYLHSSLSDTTAHQQQWYAKLIELVVAETGETEEFVDFCLCQSWTSLTSRQAVLILREKRTELN